jgi:dTDP-glucose 4,6-dehydratase
MLKIATITGCAGFIGSELTTNLLRSGWYVYGIDKMTYASNRPFINYILKEYPNSFNFIEKDIAELDRLPDCDVIFNLAAESDVDTSNANSKQFVLSNVLGVQNLLHLVSSSAIIKDEPPLFFQISTDEVYGATPDGTYKFTETDTLNPGNPYSATKAAADLLIMSWANTHGIKYNIVRPSNNYGFRQHPEKLIPLAIKKLMRNQKIKLHNKGKPVRTWTSVEDTVDGILAVYHSGKRNEIYNISSEFEQSNIITITNLIKEFHGNSVDMQPYMDFTYNRPGQDMRYAVSSNKLSALGWKAYRNINISMHGLVNYYKHGDFRW